MAAPPPSGFPPPASPPPSGPLPPLPPRRDGVVRHSMPPPAAAPLLRPSGDISRAASTGRRAPVIRRKESMVDGWGDGPGKPEGLPFGDPPEPLPLPLPLVAFAAPPTFRNVPENCGGTYVSDMSSPASRRIGAVDLEHSVGVYFSLGVRRCFVARISAKILNLHGPPEFTADAIMAAKIRHEVVSRLDEEARRSRWPEANAHMRETACFVCSSVAGSDWDRSTLSAVVLGVQDWLGWKGKLKGALLRFGGMARPGTLMRDNFVMNRKVLGDAGPKELESAESMKGVDDRGSGQLWEISVIRSVPRVGDDSRWGSPASMV